VTRVSVVGGLVLLLAASTAFAQQGGGRGRGMGFQQSGVMLLGMDEVRKEIGTTDEQNKQIDELQQELRGSFGGFQGFGDLSAEERQKRMDEIRKKGEEIDAKLARVLKPEQLDRLNQLRVQREGALALTRADVQEKLGFSQEQKDKVRKAQEAGRPPAGFNFQNASDEDRAKLREAREKAEADTLAVLTPEQKKKFDEMKGKPFEFPRGNFGGNRPRNNN
jgi:Spy/CpxP family protein refolding chaperone